MKEQLENKIERLTARLADAKANGRDIQVKNVTKRLKETKAELKNLTKVAKDEVVFKSPGISYKEPPSYLMDKDEEVIEDDIIIDEEVEMESDEDEVMPEDDKEPVKPWYARK